MNISTKSTTKQKKALRLAIAALILTLQLTSCQSSKVSEAPQFPDPYDTEGNLIVTYDVNTDKVSMPLWYWKKIVRYAVDVQGVKEE